MRNNSNKYEYASDIISDGEMMRAQKETGWDENVEEGRLHVLELLVKAGAGYYNSHTEERLLSMLDLMTKKRTPNKMGRLFIMRMTYKHSNLRPKCFELMEEYRQ